MLHWRGEVIAFLGDAKSRFSPSMRQRIDLAKQWRLATRQTAAERDIRPVGLPDECPFTLDDLLADDADPTALAAQIG